MPDSKPLAKSELEIARIVWQLGKATVRQVADALPPDRDLDFWTVQTYLRRLEKKGYLKVSRQGRTNVYSSRKRPQTVIAQVTEEFLNRMFDGEAMPLFQYLVQQRGLSDHEIDELQATLDRLKRDQHRGDDAETDHA